MSTVTESQLAAATNIALAIADTIREVGSVPSGQLYAQLMGKLDLGQYQALIGILKQAGLVSERHNLLTWTGPKKGGAS